MSSADLGRVGAQEWASLIAASYVPALRTATWGSRGRKEGAWLAGVSLFLVLSGLVPLTFVMMTLLSVLAVATCLRAYALHEYARQLTELAMNEPPMADDDAESTASGSAAGAAGGASTPARRRARRPSLFTAVASARPLSLLNLRLSLMDRDFTEQDFDLLMRLDELEAATRTDPAPPPLPEAQLANLPVHVHRSPAKKGKAKQQSAFLDAAAALRKLGPGAPLPAAPAAEKAASCGAACSPAPPAFLPRPAAQQQQKQQPAAAAPQLPQTALRAVPVLVESLPLPPHPTTPGHAAEPAGRRLQAAPAARRALVCSSGSDDDDLEIQAACSPTSPVLAAAEAAAASPAAAGACESEVEDDTPLCSICLDPFEDGAKILSLPCRHQYHVDCVTQWLRLKGMDSTCPNCKGTVFRPEDSASCHAAQQAAAAPALAVEAAR